jgi:3-hydroxyacyl-CoA dehydrogenase
MDAARAASIRTGNTEDDLQLLADCDLVVEVIIEQPRPKQQLFARLEEILKPTAIVSSNTSGIPMKVLTEGRSERFRTQFLGTHFFAPPRYMHLLELIPTPDTDPAVVEQVRRFGERILGKGIVVAKDAPGFVANRLGVYGMNRTIALMEQFDLTIDEVDGLTGPLLGRPKSATVPHRRPVGARRARARDARPRPGHRRVVRHPGVVRRDDRQQAARRQDAGRLLQEGGQGHPHWNHKSGQYAPQQRLETPELKAALRQPLAQRVAAIKAMPGKYGEFLRALLADTARYTLETAPQLAHDVPSVDRAMEWGYGHEAGPFRIMDMLGVDFLKQALGGNGTPAPALLDRVQGTFYRDGADGEEVLGFDGQYRPVAPIEDHVRLARVAAQPGRVLEQNEGARLLDLGDGVALLEFRSKSNTLGSKVLDLLATSLERVERDGMAGLVIGNDDPKFFSAGADLSESTGAVIAGMWDVIERRSRASSRRRRASATRPSRWSSRRTA